jgi:hypothetical protein
MQAEVDFLNYACLVAPHYVPQLVHQDFSMRCIVMECLQGKRYPEGEVPQLSDIEAAIDFFRLLNADLNTARKYIWLDAAEGFSRLSDHLDNIEKRLNLMETDHLPREVQTQATKLLNEVKVAFEAAINRTEWTIAAGTVADGLDPDKFRVSPSDFGFHNAVRTITGPKFIDFEFAGWDDPAKTAADFVLQPRVPTGNPLPSLLKASNCHQMKEIKQRCKVLGSVLRIKWLCIILSVLEPARLTRVLDIHPKIDPKALTYQRLRQAAKYLQQELPFGIH